MRTAFYNGRIFTGEKFIENAVVEGTVITSGDALPGARIDLRGGILAPAFIDLQLYGGNNQLFGEHPSVEALKATLDYSFSGGTTLILPTVATNSQQTMLAAIEAVREYWDKGFPGVAGLHLEGPFISPAKRGAHIPGFIKKPTLQDAEELMRAGKGIIKMMTLAPEVCPPEVISYLQDNGVIISAGHTDATFEQAFNNNITLATHLFNAMSPLQHRAPGMVGAILYNENVQATIIADGHHVDYPVIAIAKKIMGERLLLITDAVTTNTSGVYQHQLKGDKYVMPDGTLSGSALTMLKAVRNCVEHVGISLEESLRMASLYPARVLRLDHKRGRIEKGYDAELIWLNEKLELKGVYTNGSLTHMPA
ncbi:MAG TPA: N-acetylglucosamine-6-phosphate deacetylase [Chitinophagaceae bacterium]|nr:N-acetylglucosamine-6-phosphate deacetylase [Chitinophagaceae bacterium]